MWEESRGNREGIKSPVADIDAIATYVAEAVYCSTRLYDGLLRDDEEFTIVVRLLGTQDRELTTFNPRKACWGEYICRIPQIEVPRKMSMANWRAGVVDHAVDIAKDIFLRFNWDNPNLEATRETIEKMFARRL
jgi:hypothetical protein